MKTTDLTALLRGSEKIPLRSQLALTFALSLPAILAQVSSVFMGYIDASMVGSLGASGSASIGLISSSTWLLGGLCTACAVGFTVPVAHRIGAGDDKGARGLVRQGLVVALLFSLLLACGAMLISPYLPVWLGGDADITGNASRYFLIFAFLLPLRQLRTISAGMLQCSGNMKFPSISQIIMCFLDVVFNFFLIFPTRKAILFGLSVTIPGFGLGVSGAALGTLLAEAVCASRLLWFLLARSGPLKLHREEKTVFNPVELRQSAKTAVPVALENIIMSGAQVALTGIVAPLGTIAIAANSLSVTAESLCYMPGYGIGTAATTLVGQSLGAGREDMARRFGWLSTVLGIVFMSLSGVLLYVFAPQMIGLLSPDPEVRALGVMVLRIEAFAEPLYGVSMVANGVFRGTGRTLVPTCLNLLSMWFVRLPMAWYLAPVVGLRGVWIAMAMELSCRGILFLIRLHGKKWSRKV